jgi:hypothetical protein
MVRLGDPLKYITEIQRVKLVMIGGKIVKKSIAIYFTS